MFIIEGSSVVTSETSPGIPYQEHGITPFKNVMKQNLEEK